MQQSSIPRSQPSRSSVLRTKVLAVQRAGAPLSAQMANKILGKNHDSWLRANIERAAQWPEAGRAVAAGVITDHRVVSVIGGMDSAAADMVLALESRLGRHLSRARAQKIKAAYQRILDRRSSNVVCLDEFRRMVCAVTNQSEAEAVKKNEMRAR